MSNPKSTASIAGPPLHPMLVPFPIAFFVGTLGAGIVLALVAALAGFTDFIGDARIRALGMAWGHFLGNLGVVAIEAFNLYRRVNVGPDSIEGLRVMLSLAAVLLMLVTGWLGWEMVYRRRVGIADEQL